MASMGLKYLAWAKMTGETDSAVPTYDTGLVLGKLVSVQMTIANAEGELYADDMLAEYVREFSSGELAAEVDNISLENQAKVYGARYADGELQFSANDNAPYGGIGGYQVLQVHGNKKYRAWFFPKARAAVPDLSGATKGSSITFGSEPIKAKILAPLYGAWYYVKEFETEAAAKAYIDGKLGVGAWYNVNVQAQGGTVSPVGSTGVAAGGSFELTIDGTATKLYDNGVDKTSDISDGVYTISDIAADHNIAVIF